MFFVFFNDTATTEIYTLSLHDALPILVERLFRPVFIDPLPRRDRRRFDELMAMSALFDGARSEEHTSELQSRQYLVCRLLLEKKTTPSSQATTSTCLSLYIPADTILPR